MSDNAGHDLYHQTAYCTDSNNAELYPVYSAFSDDDEDEESDSQTDNEDVVQEDEDSEDDIPLAQRIPGALKAQTSIRIKHKADRDRRRKERLAFNQQVRSLQSRPDPVPVKDLTHRLLQLSSSTTKPPSVPPLSPPLYSASTARRPDARQVSPPLSRNISQQPSSQTTLSRVPSTRPRTKSISHTHRPASPPRQNAYFDASQTITRSTTHSQRLQKGGSAADVPSATASRQGELPKRTPVVTEVYSHNTSDQHAPRQVRSRTMSLSRSASHQVLHRARTAGSKAAPPLPVLSPSGLDIKQQDLGANVIQQRIFIGNMQRFNTVEIRPQTRAGDILDAVARQGELGNGVSRDGWMLWEIAQDFGMERPLRDYELPSEVYASWNSNTRMNAFMIKQTPLAAVLARHAIPTSSPMCGGYIQWESKRGRWTKRWMELREHSLWLCKNNTGKDSTFLCSLSNFDCYYVSRLHKAPKPFVFAVKSTDNLTLFENPADYLHIFACDQTEGPCWMERILLARSYVLHKERTILFGISGTNPSSVKETSVAPSSLDKGSTSARFSPFIAMNTAKSSITKIPFQSGSLLAKVSN